MFHYILRCWNWNSSWDFSEIRYFSYIHALRIRSWAGPEDSCEVCLSRWGSINTLRPKQNGRHFPDDIFKWIFLNKNVWISINMSLEFFPRGPINNIPTLVQVMAWRRPGDKPLSEPVMVRVPTHICIIRPQWVKEENFTLRVDCFTLLLARHLADVSCYIAKPLGTWNRLRFMS